MDLQCRNYAANFDLFPILTVSILFCRFADEMNIQICRLKSDSSERKNNNGRRHERPW